MNDQQQPVLSPVVRRALEARGAWTFTQPAEATLGDRIPADGRFAPSEAEVLDLIEDERSARP